MTKLEFRNFLNNYKQFAEECKNIFKKEFPDKDIWIYSGDTFETLMQSPIKRRILKKCDVLIDGPFIQEQYDPDLAFRGSSNQRIIDLKEKFIGTN
jgi:organic radical activating enzyme